MLNMSSSLAGHLYIFLEKCLYESRVWNFKNTMLKKRREREKKKQGQKIIKNIYVKFAEEKKIGSFFFCKVIGYKSEN